MKVLLTGATSGLGLNAANWLLQNGHQLHATGRDKQAGSRLRQLGAKFTELELSTATSHECDQLMQGCDAVWHCAAKSSPWGDKDEFHLTNVVATDKLAKAAGLCGVARFVHISTPAIYFDFQDHYDLDESYRPATFANHYASSKYQAEEKIRALIPLYPDTTFVILRPRGLFGPHDRVVLPRLLERISRDRAIVRLPRRAEATLDMTFVLNVVHAMHLATRNTHLKSGAVFNITNHQPMRLADLLNRLLADQLALEYQIKNVPYRLMHALAAVLELGATITRKEPALTRYSVATVNFDMTLSQTRAIEELGYRPLYSIEQGIRLTGEWLKANSGANHG